MDDLGAVISVFDLLGLPVGAKLRLGVVVKQVDEIAGGVQVTWELTFEIEGNPKPACVAEVIYRSYE